MNDLTTTKKPVDILNDARDRLISARHNQAPNDAVIVATLGGVSLALASSFSLVGHLIAGTQVEPGQWLLLALGLLGASATWISRRV